MNKRLKFDLDKGSCRGVKAIEPDDICKHLVNIILHPTKQSWLWCEDGGDEVKSNETWLIIKPTKTINVSFTKPGNDFIGPTS